MKYVKIKKNKKARHERNKVVGNVFADKDPINTNKNAIKLITTLIIQDPINIRFLKLLDSLSE